MAQAVARDASRLLLDGYRRNPAFSEKARRDLVTEFDLRSEELIRARLTRATPGIAIVAEEGGGAASGLTWYCDPLDGTMNFVHGHPFFCVSIGAVDEQGPLAGAVVAPAMGIEWWGGARRRGVPKWHPLQSQRYGAALGIAPGNGFPGGSIEAS